MTQKKQPFPLVPVEIEPGRIHPQWVGFFENLRVKAATQSDAATVSNPPTQAEVNAIVGVINDLIDKLQAAGLME